ncbi:MAG: hypothetical protein D6755_10410, partial [Anaerolineae bacterium]
ETVDRGPLTVEAEPSAEGEAEPSPPEWVLEGEAPEEEAAPGVSWDAAGEPVIEKLDLNQASLVQLERLPGIGFRLAQAIVNYREANGPFRSLDELGNVPGIGPMTTAELRNFLRVEAPSDISRRRRPTGMPLPDAEAAIASGSLAEAAAILEPVIRSGAALDEIIHLLKQALFTHPRSFELWQALGDACLRADRLEEALDAYNQAEEILASNG